MGGNARSDPAVILGHGASGTAASMRPWVEALAARGVAARAIDLPKGRAERAVPVFSEAIAAAGGVVVAGGHSFGGRVASLAVAERLAAGEHGERDEGGEHGQGRVAALLLLSYPLHPPGKPELWDERTSHWPQLCLPVLLLSGESDPFAKIELLREAAGRLPDGNLVTYARLGHGLAPVLDDAADRAAEFIRGLSRRESAADVRARA